MSMPMLAGVGLLVVCCSSSSVASLMMGGGETIEETKSAETTPVVPTLPSGQHVKLVHTVAQDNSAEGNVDDKNMILNLAELEVFAKDGTTQPCGG